jgi:hypothetical protein
MKEVKRSGSFVRVGKLQLQVPASVAHLCSPEGQLKSIHGLEPTDTCVCGELVSMEGHGRCVSCGKPYRRKCTSCEGWVVVDKKVNGRWYEPPSQCGSCESTRADKARRALLGGIPACTREAALAYRKGCEHRADGDAALRGWLEDDCGRVLGASLCVWLYGPHNVGKSVSVARACTHAVATGMVESFLWTTSRELLEASKMRFIEGGGAYRALLDRARNAELVVIDEMWNNARKSARRLVGVEGATANGMLVMSDIIRSRIDHRMPTLFTSMYPMDSIRQLMGESSWHRVSGMTEMREVELGPVDMRDA